MHEEAEKILNFLPIRKIPAENDYIEHLFGALRALDEGEKHVRGFAILPLHLLFLLAIQYKILRVATEQKEIYSLSITLKNPIKKEEMEILAPRSPFILGFFNEKELVQLSKVLKVDDKCVKAMKELINYRNDKIAHAKGYVESNLENKVEEYLSTLEMLQPHMLPMNNNMGQLWEKELDPGDDIVEFVETRLLGSYLCPADFNDGLLKSKFNIF
ncbi:MAG TPA: hypothetical protein VG984_01225 [Candidatus Paceibacterota bacterium]|nr:hypothetical protein [Candidatus Paceibacterota bacterium]